MSKAVTLSYYTLRRSSLLKQNNVTLLTDECNAQWAHNLLELYGLGENEYKL